MQNEEGNKPALVQDQEMSLAQALKVLQEVMPVIAKHMKAEEEVKAEPAAEIITEDQPEEGEKKDEKKEAPAMDAAVFARQVEQTIAHKSALYGKVSAVIGAFDHSDMTIDKMAAYALDKMEVTAPQTGKVAFLEAYLLGKGAVPTVALDAGDKKPASFLTKYLNKE